MGDAAGGPTFHNITIYLAKDRLEDAARLYREVLGLRSVFAPRTGGEPSPLCRRS
jgi:hypothetical protein